ncbi:MAG: hemerythrin [Tissierellia bacterium]|nr:hemerythrin [Tissierellia bacterium]
MESIEILVEEHENILKFTDICEKECIEILDGKEVSVDFFRDAIEFIRNYADDYHHGKEERILFDYMIKHLGKVAESLVRYGMFVEHDLARKYVRELENYLNEYEREKNTKNKLGIISNMMAYVYLLRDHADKENKLVYPFAEKNLDDKLFEEINKLTILEKENAIKEGKIVKYLDFIKEN